MTVDEIAELYHSYIACLNGQDWENLHLYVAEDALHNGKQFGFDGYREMLVGDFKAIPDLCFNIDHLVCQPPMVAARLRFDCTPIGVLFDIPVNGKRVQFHENVFYEVADGKIQNVWSMIDKAAIASQI